LLELELVQGSTEDPPPLPWGGDTLESYNTALEIAGPGAV